MSIASWLARRYASKHPYCRKCGKAMGWHDYTHRYDDRTGKRIEYVVWSCGFPTPSDHDYSNYAARKGEEA